MVINVSEEHTATIFSPEGGCSMFLQNTGNIYKSTWYHNPQGHHRHSTIVLCFVYDYEKIPIFRYKLGKTYAAYI
jgi:hypothetical protein